ncbi:hypothetical protein OI450_17450 [Pectobacterium cacticida]|uniref:Uncharacterized protein n=1 Tax=Pectobacterium cacticida TaxID=69221 RepID=A0ABZ2GD59_9GAMM|nr:hypothetical protein [Pectobacterium cacticida]UYX06650.1 hypothetical protein OI450_17450 [Pectobacterium cacticida]
MMGKIVQWKCLLLAGALMMSTANAAEEPLRIRNVFDINSAFCAIKTNGVLGMDNRDSAVAGRGFGTASTNALMVLENGENEITVEIGALDWFLPGNDSDNAHKAFAPDARCKVALTAFKGKETSVLTQFTIAIGQDGIPYVQSGGEAEPGKMSKVTVKKIRAQQVEKGHFPSDYFIDNYFPAGMDLYQFTQKIYLKNIPEWKWTTATPFTGTPEQVHALQMAYLELWHYIKNKNKTEIRKYLSESSKAWAMATGDNVDDIYESNAFLEDLNKTDFKILDVNWNNYDLEVMNDNRMVRFINKSDPTFSPITYLIADESGNKVIRGYSPIFSFIKGKVMLVI